MKNSSVVVMVKVFLWFVLSATVGYSLWHPADCQVVGPCPGRFVSVRLFGCRLRTSANETGDFHYEIVPVFRWYVKLHQ